MSRYRPLLLFGIAAAIALCTSVLIYNFLDQINASRLPVPAKTINMAVAAANLPWGTKLTPTMVQMVSLPPDSMPEGHFQTAERLAGRILLTNLKTNEAILESKLAPVNVATGGLAAVTDPEKRAMAVKVDEVVGVAGFVKPGDRVDVMASIRTNRDKTHEQFVKTVLENILVLASGSDVIRKGKDEEPSVVKVVTLEVTPEEAEKLALASTEGGLRLSLRHPLNQTPMLTKGATLASLMNSYLLKDKPEPAAPKRAASRREDPPNTKIEVIKGGTVKSVTFE